MLFAIVAFCVLHVAQLPNMLVAQHAVQTSLAEAWWARVHDHPETSEERLFATSNLASSLYAAGKYVESERVEQELLLLKKRICGPEHPSTLKTMGTLAASLAGQGKHADAERIQRLLLEATRKCFGAEHRGVA